LPLIKPSRRQILLAAPALILPRAAYGWSHGVSVPVAVPVPAAQYGLKTLRFYDPCTSLATVDMTNSQQPGFNWYLQNAWPSASSPGSLAGDWSCLTAPATSSSLITYSGGIITNGNASTPRGGYIHSACYSASPPGYIGTAINMANACYMEVTMQFDPAARETNTALHPDLWSHAIEFFLGTATHFVEIDVMEAVNTAATYTTAMQDWDVNAGTLNSPTNAQTGIVSDANPHKYGMLYLSPSFNGGTGIVRRFYDDAYLPSQDVTFTTTGPCSPGASPSNPNGMLSEIQNQHFIIDIGGGDAWPAKFLNIGVWQLSATG
jgi:hypothetical protein